MAVMDALAEDDGPVVLGRRRSRHGNYYEEIPPEPEPLPEPVPEVPVHVPEPLAVGEWGAKETALDYVKALEAANYQTYTAVWSPINGAPNQWSSTGMGPTGSYSISLNDVIGSYKGGSIAQTPNGNTYLYDPVVQAAMKAADEAITKECTHPHGLTYMMDTMIHRCQVCGYGITDEFLKQSLPKECGHTYTEGVGQGKFKFNKKRSGGTAIEKVRCVTCGLEFSKERKF